MRRADRARVGSGLLALTAWWLVGCAGAPAAPEPVLRVQALQAQTDGLRRYARGDYDSAAQYFTQAIRLQQSLDDGAAADANRLNLAAVALARQQPEVALARASEVQDAAFQGRVWQIQAQAYLALGQLNAARPVLAQAHAACAARCPQQGSLWLLQARLELASGQAREALRLLQQALPVLQAQGEAREVANVWRNQAQAHLALGETALALAAAQTALTQDRELALPVKIAQDWMLLGDIHQHAKRTGDARAAYQRALAVANAAGLKALAQQASQRAGGLQ